MVTKQDTRVLSHAITNKDHEVRCAYESPRCGNQQCMYFVNNVMATAPRAAQWLIVADGTRHPVIESSSDNSDDKVAAGGLRWHRLTRQHRSTAAAAEAGDASEDDESEVALGAAGARS